MQDGMGDRRGKSENSLKNLKAGEHGQERTGPSKGPRWSTVIRKFMEMPARKDFAELAREMGFAKAGEPVTIRTAMLATAAKRFLEGSPKVVGSEDNERIIYTDAGDPRILVALMDREDGKPTQPIEGGGFDLTGAVIKIGIVSRPNQTGEAEGGG